MPIHGASSSLPHREQCTQKVAGHNIYASPPMQHCRSDLLPTRQACRATVQHTDTHTTQDTGAKLLPSSSSARTEAR